MNEQLLNILKKAIEIAEETGDFVIEQSPLLLQEFFTWHTTKAIFAISISFISILIITFIVYKTVKLYNDKTIYWLNLISIVPFIIVCIYTYKLIFITIAPKLYLIDYLLNPGGYN